MTMDMITLLILLSSPAPSFALSTPRNGRLMNGLDTNNMNSKESGDNLRGGKNGRRSRRHRALYAWQTATPYADPDALCAAGATGYRATRDCSGFVFCNNGYLMGGGNTGEAIGSVTKCDAGMKYDEAAGMCTATGGTNCPTSSSVSTSSSSSLSSSSSSSPFEENEVEDEEVVEVDESVGLGPLPTSTSTTSDEVGGTMPSSTAGSGYYDRPSGPDGPTDVSPPSPSPPTLAWDMSVEEAEATPTEYPTTPAQTTREPTPNDGALDIIQSVVVDGSPPPSAEIFDVPVMGQVEDDDTLVPSASELVTFDVSSEVDEVGRYDFETGKGWKGESWSPSCPESFTGNLAYPECTGYATCIDGIFVGAPVECDAGLLFNKVLGLCDFEDNVTCEEVGYGEDDEDDDDMMGNDDVGGIGSLLAETSPPTLSMVETWVDNDGEDWSLVGTSPPTPELTPQPSMTSMTSSPVETPPPTPDMIPQLSIASTTSSPVFRFEGDPTRRFCGKSWKDVIDNCL